MSSLYFFVSSTLMRLKEKVEQYFFAIHFHPVEDYSIQVSERCSSERKILFCPKICFAEGCLTWQRNDARYIKKWM